MVAVSARRSIRRRARLATIRTLQAPAYVAITVSASSGLIQRWAPGTSRESTASATHGRAVAMSTMMDHNVRRRTALKLPRTLWASSHLDAGVR
jgi:hypothetical protein